MTHPSPSSEGEGRAVAADQKATGQSIQGAPGERIESSMRPHCKSPTACRAKTEGKHCPPCGLSAKWSDPEFREKRRAAFRAKFANDPEFRAKHVAASDERLRRWRDSPACKLGENAQSLANLAKANEPAAIARRTELVRKQRLGWCPRHRVDEYLKLARKMPAADARQAILDSERTEARRQIAEFDRKQRERAAREKAQAY